MDYYTSLGEAQTSALSTRKVARSSNLSDVARSHFGFRVPTASPRTECPGPNGPWFGSVGLSNPKSALSFQNPSCRHGHPRILLCAQEVSAKSSTAERLDLLCPRFAKTIKCEMGFIHAWRGSVCNTPGRRSSTRLLKSPSALHASRNDRTACTTSFRNDPVPIITSLSSTDGS